MGVPKLPFSSLVSPPASIFEEISHPNGIDKTQSAFPVAVHPSPRLPLASLTTRDPFISGEESAIWTDKTITGCPVAVHLLLRLLEGNEETTIVTLVIDNCTKSMGTCPPDSAIPMQSFLHSELDSSIPATTTMTLDAKPVPCSQETTSEHPTITNDCIAVDPNCGHLKETGISSRQRPISRPFFEVEDNPSPPVPPVHHGIHHGPSPVVIPGAQAHSHAETTQADSELLFTSFEHGPSAIALDPKSPSTCPPDSASYMRSWPCIELDFLPESTFVAVFATETSTTVP